MSTLPGKVAATVGAAFLLSLAVLPRSDPASGPDALTETLADDVVSLGTFLSGSPGPHAARVILRNRGDLSIEIIDVATDCGCISLSPGVRGAELPPGGQLSYDFDVSIDGLTGSFGKKLTLTWRNGQFHRQQVVRLQGRVVPALEWMGHPSIRASSLGELLEDAVLQMNSSSDVVSELPVVTVESGLWRSLRFLPKRGEHPSQWKVELQGLVPAWPAKRTVLPLLATIGGHHARHWLLLTPLADVRVRPTSISLAALSNGAPRLEFDCGKARPETLHVRPVLDVVGEGTPAIAICNGSALPSDVINRLVKGGYLVVCVDGERPVVIPVVD